MSQVLVVACGIFSCGLWTLSCGIRDIVPWPEIKSGLHALGVQILNHWTTKEVLLYLLYSYCFTIKFLFINSFLNYIFLIWLYVIQYLSVFVHRRVTLALSSTSIRILCVICRLSFTHVWQYKQHMLFNENKFLIYICVYVYEPHTFFHMGI